MGLQGAAAAQGQAAGAPAPAPGDDLLLIMLGDGIEEGAGTEDPLSKSLF